MAKGHSKYMKFKKGIKSMQIAGYNGARTVFYIQEIGRALKMVFCKK